MTSHARLEIAAIRLAFRKRILRYTKCDPHKVPLVKCRTFWQAAIYEVNLAVMKGEVWPTR